MTWPTVKGLCPKSHFALQFHKKIAVVAEDIDLFHLRSWLQF